MSDSYEFYRSRVMEADDHISDAAKANWIKMAVQFLRVMLTKNVLHRFTAEAARSMAYVHDLPPASDVRWWGQVMQAAKREGLIEQYAPLGVPLTATSKAGHKTPVWVRAQ